MKLNLIIIILVALGLRVSSQEIGQDAILVKQTVDYFVQSHNNSSGYRQVKMFAETKYCNTKISEVILFQENVPALDSKLMGRTFNFTTHYVMKDNLLYKVQTEYDNLTYEELLSITEQKNKIDDYYFTENYSHYYKLSINSKGKPIQEYFKTNIEELPIRIKKVIEEYNNKKQQEANRQILLPHPNKEEYNNKQQAMDEKSKRTVMTMAQPSYFSSTEGVVTVEVFIDKNGNVIKALNTDKTTISDENAIKASIEAALKSKFSTIEKDTITTVTLTYKFRIQ